MIDISGLAGSVIGGVFASLIAIIVWEWLKQPRLAIEIPERIPEREPAIQRLNQTSRAFYHLRVRNNGKTPAYSCRIMMRFVNRMNGEPLFTVNGKWDRGPQPLLYAPLPRRILPDGTVETAIGEFPHDFLIPFAEVLDVHPKIPENFCVLLKYENEDECYAFSSWSYLRGRGHRVDEWRLNAGEYIAEIELSYSGRRILEKFLLRNHSRNADGAEISKWYNE